VVDLHQETQALEDLEEDHQEQPEQEMKEVILHQKETLVVHKALDHYTPEVVAEVLEVSEETAQLIQATEEPELHQILITPDQQQIFLKEDDQEDILHLHQQDQQVQLILEKVEKVQTVLFLKEVPVVLEDQVMYL
jgi:ABC-type uncharacterized transport system permease subunit